MSKRLATLILLLLGLLLPLLCLEAGLRLLHYPTYYSDPMMFMAVPNERQYTLRPNWMGWYAGVPVEINALGLRHPHNGTMPSEAILMLGDSILFGQGLTDEETLPAQLQQALQIPTINAGVPGYRTVEQAVQLEHLLTTLHPSLVILLYLVDNDTDLAPGLHVLNNPQSLWHRASAWAYQHSPAYNLIRHRVRILFAQPVPNAGLDGFAPSDLGWQESQSALLQIKRLCDNEKVAFLLAGGGFVERLHGLDVVAAFAHQHHIPYVELWRTIDLTTYFREQAVTPYDGHPNAQTVQLMASRLAERLPHLMNVALTRAQ